MSGGDDSTEDQPELSGIAPAETPIGSSGSSLSFLSRNPGGGSLPSSFLDGAPPAVVLRDADSRYRQVVSCLPVAVYTCEAPTGVITFYNEKATELWGRRPEAGSTDERFCGAFRLWYPDGSLLRHEDTPMAQAMLTGESFRNIEVTIERPDQSRITVLVNIDPIFDSEGRIIGAINAFHDISALTAAEAEIRRRYIDGVKLTETNRALVGALSYDQVTTVICKAARELCAADGATFVMRDKDHVHYVAEDAIEPLWQGMIFPIESCISGWAILNDETAVIEDIYSDERIPQAAYRPTFVKSLAMMPVGPGCPVASIGIYWRSNWKATEYQLELLTSLASAADLALAGVRAYEEARSARAQAEQANRLKDEFLATLSHELRNPLNSVVGFSEILLRNPEAMNIPLVSRAAKVIHDNAQAQAQLINDLLDLSRLRTGKLNIELKPLHLNEVVSNAVDAMRREASEKEIHLNVAVPDDELIVHGDNLRLQQITWNLLSNAIKFSSSGSTVRVYLKRVGTNAELTVEDNGAGISTEFLPQVYEMFRQADAGISRQRGGMGIGLALVKQLTQLHGGEVRAHSDGEGCGARFTVSLPLYSSRVTHTASVESDDQKLRDVRILIVDDTQDSLEMLKALLALEGADVEAASDGETALALTAEKTFDLLISDIGMPGMDGYKLLRKIRESIPAYVDVPAIALTGFGRDEDVEQAREAGFHAHVVKPLDYDEFLITVLRVIDEHRS